MPSYCCSSSDFLQSHYTVPLSSFLLPFSCTSWSCCSLPCIFSDPSGSNRFFLSYLHWSHRSRISAVTQVFFFWRCLPKILLAVSITAVLKVVMIESRSVSSLSMMVRGANFPPIIAWKVSNTLGSFRFSRSNLSLVCFWLADSFQANVEGHHQQVVVTSNVCFWKTSCSGNVHSWSKALPH